MKVQKFERTRLSFMEKMTSKDPKTLRSYNVTINNFENFCMEKYGTDKSKWSDDVWEKYEYGDEMPQ